MTYSQFRTESDNFANGQRRSNIGTYSADVFLRSLFSHSEVKVRGDVGVITLMLMLTLRMQITEDAAQTYANNRDALSLQRLTRRDRLLHNRGISHVINERKFLKITLLKVGNGVGKCWANFNF